MERYVTVDRDTPMLLPVDLREWVMQDDMVHFVIEAVEGMKLSKFRTNLRGTGSEQYPPTMMLALLIYGYANGIFSSRRIERATYRDLGVRYLTGDTHPDHDTIAKFRTDNFDAIAECFVKTLGLAKQMGVLKVGTVSVDGTQIKANGSKHKNVTYERSVQLEEQLEVDIRELMNKARHIDEQEDTDAQTLPKELARREKLREKMRQAREYLEQRAKERAEAERAEYERKVEAREQRQGRAKGKRIQIPSEIPGKDEQVNLVDHDSRLMRKSKKSGYEQCYNAQAVVDADGSQMVISSRVTQCASDRNELYADVVAISAEIGKPATVLADSGYACEQQVASIEGDGIDAYISTGSQSGSNARQYDYRPIERQGKSKREPVSVWLKQMKMKLGTEAGRKIYRLRKQTVEPVFGIIKHVMGFRQFLLRGFQKVTGEWKLVTASYNLKRLFKLQLGVS